MPTHTHTHWHHRKEEPPELSYLFVQMRGVKKEEVVTSKAVSNPTLKMESGSLLHLFIFMLIILASIHPSRDIKYCKGKYLLHV